MKTAIASLRSVSPYSQSRPNPEPKLEKELDDDYDARTWREHAHVTDDGHVMIPAMAFKNALDEAARYLSLPIKGKGKSTFTKHIEAGVMCIDPLVLPLRKDELIPERLFLNADGKRGGGRRVWRTYPMIAKWSGDVTFHVLDPIITRDVFHQCLVAAGQYIGIGRFRPRNRGFYGRFAVDDLVME